MSAESVRGLAAYLALLFFATAPLYDSLLGMLAVGALVVWAATPVGGGR